jgi:hypothetical protein
MKSITIRNLCLLNAPPSSRGLIFPRAAAKKEPRYKKNRYTVYLIRSNTSSRSCRSSVQERVRGPAGRAGRAFSVHFLLKRCILLLAR